jgi:hypothetical protein
MVKGAPLQVDLSGNFMFNEKFVLGLLIGGVLQLPHGWFQISDAMYVGYAYDFETTRLNIILAHMKFSYATNYLK